MPPAMKVRLLPLPSIKDLLELYNVHALRKLSQNFLLDSKLNKKIVKCAGKQLQYSEVCEVGPGPGNITRAIIEKQAAKIFVVEKDHRFLPTLQMLKDASPSPMEIFHGDILTFDMANIFSEDKRKAWDDDFPDIHIIGNLPFNVSTPLMMRWLRSISEKSNAWSYGRVRMTLTFQHEVAERMVAPVMTAPRCRFSVMCQNWCLVEYKFLIPGRAFLPKPKVDVGVVHLKPHKEPIIPLPFDLVQKVVAALFRYRQKYCIKGIETLFPSANKDLAMKMFNDADLNPKTRSFQLSVEEIGKLCFAYKRILEEHPNLVNYGHAKTDNEWLEIEETENTKFQDWQKKLVEDNFY